MEMKNTLPQIFNCEKTIFDKKKFEKCDMTSFNLGKQKQPLEVFNKKVFLKISQKSQESTYAKVSSLIMLQGEVCNFI